MRGIGKTTLMQQINNEMGQRGNIFVIWVTVSHNDTKTIQNNIARSFYSTKELKEFKTKDEIRVRAGIISYHLKRIVSLIIFDDVRDDLNFTDIGIDINDENLRCQIVLTTRDQDICQRLGAEQIKMNARLDETESLKFFRKYSYIDDNNNPNHLRINHIAQEICRKCAGLPLAISVVAKTLRGEEEEIKWNKCLNFLSEGCPQKVSNFVKDVYVPLKFSYEDLEEDDLKMGFLLCSLFPQGQEIQLKDFICYDIGPADKCVRKDRGQRALNTYRGQRALNTYRDIFISLKRKGLLQDVVEEKEDKKNSARMHDVIRDVAISIAENEFEGFFNIKKFITSIQNLNLTDQLRSEVQFLSFNGNKILESIPPDFFKRMANLLFLDLRGTSISIKEFTETCLQKLAKLRVLMFETLHQNITVDTTDLFFLQHLSVLCLQNVHISELNQEFSKKLIHLRSIDFSNTVIVIIRPKVFSILRDTLEELYMQGSYSKWKAYNQEDGDYVAFEELKDLENLYSLHIDIDDKTIFSREYAPSLVIPSVEYFSIRYIRSYDEPRVWSSNMLVLPYVQLSNFAKWSQVLLIEKTKALSMCDFDNCATQEISSVIEQDIVKLLCNLKRLDLGYFRK
ncbi:NB-ARC domain-containing disease resistance protein [Zostera marina]|uniref:NB-ARC domain-containing disease resistance protein n=1 Tax=Zostera marina TaxID=29655 RepID=A0A0K9PX42_ZOSMR|nr:NB-ARC domain-containing disease resistance protein [Zostera marina]